MITIFHGENISQSRKEFIDLKQLQNSPLTYSGLGLTLTELNQALEGNELFETNQPIFIEELITKNKPGKNLDLLTSFLSAHSSKSIFLWESKELTKKQLQLFNKPEIKQFNMPKSLFSFLDSLYPGHEKAAIKFYHETLKTEEPELIFFMIIRQIRIMLALIEKSSDKQPLKTIDEVSRLAPWQKNKLQIQANTFGKDKLLNLYFKLFELEKGLKTGSLSMSLKDEIDFLLLEI